MKTRMFLAAAAVTLCATAGPASAFPDKNITFIIPFSPGGGFDVYVRLVSPYVEKYLPKKVSVVPKNMPGAGGRKGLTAGYRAKPDGHTLTIANVPGVAIPPILGQDVSYDLGKMSWIARLSVDHYLLGVAGKSKVDSVDALKTLSSSQVIKMPSTGAGSTAHAMSKIFIGVVGFKGEVVSGYQGTKEMTIAVIRGDVPASTLPVNSTRKYIQSGDIKPLMTTEETSSLPGVKSAKELGLDDLDGLAIQRLVGAAPGVPHAVRQILSDAFTKAMADPKLVAAANKAKRPFAPLGGAEAKRVLDKQLAVYLKFKDDLAK
ncbi:MAG: tripartite tricarboxylate transporter substrate binding protein [Alphaproteobacteria bacterium]|nr:tripartite tricarboxylate transporter substrate binding protein [Alphaproteobacteria bacterium]